MFSSILNCRNPKESYNVHQKLNKKTAFCNFSFFKIAFIARQKIMFRICLLETSMAEASVNRALLSLFVSKILNYNIKIRLIGMYCPAVYVGVMDYGYSTNSSYGRVPIKPNWNWKHCISFKFSNYR